MLTFWGNKKPSSRQHLLQGAQDGIYQELTLRGKVVVEGHYRGDEKHGVWKEWTPEGVPTLEQTLEARQARRRREEVSSTARSR